MTLRLNPKSHFLLNPFDFKTYLVFSSSILLGFNKYILIYHDEKSTTLCCSFCRYHNCGL